MNSKLQKRIPKPAKTEPRTSLKKPQSGNQASATAAAGGGSSGAATANSPPTALGEAQAKEREVAIAEWRKGNTKPLEGLCQRILSEAPNDIFALTNQGLLLARHGDGAAAEELYRRGLEHAPNDYTLNANMAKLMLDRRRWDDARRHAERATEINPKQEVAYLNLSYANFMLGRLREAETAARAALAINPKNDAAFNNLANALKDQGLLHEAIDIYKQALALNPRNTMLYTNLALAALYDADTPLADIVNTAKAFSTQFEEPVVSLRKPHRNVALPGRRLRIGFISPDFTNHAVMFFAEPVLFRLPREHFEVFCYYTYAGGDYITERVKSHADRFRYVSVAHPERTAKQIQDDEIDILIDMAGHTAKNGLEAMCYKPAPVQVTWLGYPGTTGLKAIDWRITDAVADPSGVEAEQYTEGLVRLPGCFCVYRPHIRDVRARFDARYAVAPTPALKNGFVTFGSCNNIAKITAPSVEAWSKLLQRAPSAKLLIEGKDFGNPKSTERLCGQFAQHGIGEERLILIARDTANQYLTYHQIDIALDPFPLTGGTTTFDALWMGVPVVSLEGRSFRERLSTTILVNGGFADDVCKTVDAYLSRALALASDVDALNARRLAGREKMQASVLMDETRYVRLFGKALRMMWHQWCAKQEPQGHPADKPIKEGEDVLVAVNGRRVTLPHARAWLKRIADRAAEETPERAQEASSWTTQRAAMAIAILSVCPEDALAQAGL